MEYRWHNEITFIQLFIFLFLEHFLVLLIQKNGIYCVKESLRLLKNILVHSTRITLVEQTKSVLVHTTRVTFVAVTWFNLTRVTTDTNFDSVKGKLVELWYHLHTSKWCSNNSIKIDWFYLICWDGIKVA